MKIAEKNFRPDHPSFAASLNNMAGLYIKQGRYDDAEQLFNRALATVKKSVGTHSQVFAKILSNLASLHKDLARYDEAESEYRRAIISAGHCHRLIRKSFCQHIRRRVLRQLTQDSQD